ncbi:unnamed protein product [Phytophthora fragariaefolia]|uniref:Unnamed protein product n=1 Tax=Phytophthora fragariaefolia TaxID=1490495 RepID=A0A9W6TZ97_9STRA|nr:unnamed protein product [Phytophthora fragariaefolia]
MYPPTGMILPTRVEENILSNPKPHPANRLLLLNSGTNETTQPQFIGIALELSLEGPTTTQVEMIRIAASAETRPQQAQNDDASAAATDDPGENTPKVFISQFQSNMKISRRHSSESTAGGGRPIEEKIEEENVYTANHTKRLVRERTTHRGLKQVPRARYNSLNRAGIAAKTPIVANEDSCVSSNVKESPYHEMMARFQLRQLQRTPSATTVSSDGKRGSYVLSPIGTARDSAGYDISSQQKQFQQQHILQIERGNVIDDPVTVGSQADHLGTGTEGQVAFQPQTKNDDESAPDFLPNLWLQWMQLWWRRRLLVPNSPFSEFSQARYLITVFALHITSLVCGLPWPRKPIHLMNLILRGEINTRLAFMQLYCYMQGEAVHSDTASQNLFASLCVVVDSIVLAVVFGHVGILVANVNSNSTAYERKMEEIFATTAKLQLPSQLRERIREYYEHLWHEYECLDGEIVRFSKDLSHTLSLEVMLFKYMEVVMHVPFWKDSTPDFLRQLMLRLDVRVYLPNDFIMREGEVDDQFYMVNRGYCELSRPLHQLERVTNTNIVVDSDLNGINTKGQNNGNHR